MGRSTPNHIPQQACAGPEAAGGPPGRQTRSSQPPAGPAAVASVPRGRGFPTWRIDADTRRKLTRRLLVWFFYDRWLLDVALARGRPWTAHHYLERCRQACLDLARLHASPDIFPGGYEKAEDGVDPAHLKLLAETVVPLDLDAMAASAEALTEVLLDLGRQVGKLQDVDFPERLAQSVGRSLGWSMPGP